MAELIRMPKQKPSELGLPSAHKAINAAHLVYDKENDWWFTYGGKKLKDFRINNINDKRTFEIMARGKRYPALATARMEYVKKHGKDPLGVEAENKVNQVAANIITYLRRIQEYYDFTLVPHQSENEEANIRKHHDDRYKMMAPQVVEDQYMIETLLQILARGNTPPLGSAWLSKNELEIIYKR